MPLLPPWRRRRRRQGDKSTYAASNHRSPSRSIPDSLSVQDALSDREADHQSEFVRLPVFKQIGGAIKILPRQCGEELYDTSRISAPGASSHDPGFTFFHPSESLKF